MRDVGWSAAGSEPTHRQRRIREAHGIQHERHRGRPEKQHPRSHSRAGDKRHVLNNALETIRRCEVIFANDRRRRGIRGRQKDHVRGRCERDEDDRNENRSVQHGDDGKRGHGGGRANIGQDHQTHPLDAFGHDTAVGAHEECRKKPSQPLAPDPCRRVRALESEHSNADVVCPGTDLRDRNPTEQPAIIAIAEHVSVAAPRGNLTAPPLETLENPAHDGRARCGAGGGSNKADRVQTLIVIAPPRGSPRGGGARGVIVLIYRSPS